MEWLINRRRMMFNKAVPPAYLTFEDRRVWELVCHFYGDTELIQGKIADGTINCDGNALVYSRSVFAPCIAVPSHKLSNNSNISASAAAQNFSVVVTASNNAFASLNDEDVVIRIVQHAGNPNSVTELTTVTKAQWTAGQSNNQMTISATSTNTCIYLMVGVLGASTATANWTINAVTGNRQPVGIINKQCAAVTSLALSFSGNYLVTEFNTDALYFTNCIRTSGYANFKYTSFQYIWFPYITTYVGGGGAAGAGQIGENKSLLAVRWDSIDTFSASYNYGSSVSGIGPNYTVVTTDYYIPITGNRWYYGTFYVRDTLVSDYYGEGKLGNISTVTIKGLSELPTDHPDCPWIDDLRAKGLIPSN